MCVCVCVCVCVCSPPDDGSLQLRLGVVDDVLQDPPQRDRDGQKDEDAGDEPGFTVSPNLRRRTAGDCFCNGHLFVTAAGEGGGDEAGSLPCLSAAPRCRAAARPPAGGRREPEPAGGSTSSTLRRNTA